MTADSRTVLEVTGEDMVDLRRGREIDGEGSRGGAGNVAVSEGVHLPSQLLPNLF
jgi:hypothetical protein